MSKSEPVNSNANVFIVKANQVGYYLVKSLRQDRIVTLKQWMHSFTMGFLRKTSIAALATWDSDTSWMVWFLFRGSKRISKILVKWLSFPCLWLTARKEETKKRLYVWCVQWYAWDKDQRTGQSEKNTDTRYRAFHLSLLSDIWGYS